MVHTVFKVFPTSNFAYIFNAFFTIREHFQRFVDVMYRFIFKRLQFDVN